METDAPDRLSAKVSGLRTKLTAELLLFTAIPFLVLLQTKKTTELTVMAFAVFPVVVGALCFYVVTMLAPSLLNDGRFSLSVAIFAPMVYFALVMSAAVVTRQALPPIVTVNDTPRLDQAWCDVRLSAGFALMHAVILSAYVGIRKMRDR